MPSGTVLALCRVSLMKHNRMIANTINPKPQPRNFMTTQKWTVALAAAGMVTLPSLLRAEEKLSPISTALSSTIISGYVNTSAQWNPGTGNANPPNIPFNAGKQDGFNLDVVKLTIERPVDEAQWSAGYKADLLFGPDANSYGTRSALATGSGDFAIKQAYVSLRAPVGNGLDFKLGVWDTLMGYEVFDAGSNPNYTRSYGYWLEPVTHTGLLVSYQICSLVSVSAGVANTFGPSINERSFRTDGTPDTAESYKSYMGSVTFTAPENFGFLKGSTLYFCAMNGFNSTAPENTGNGADQTSLYAGSSINTPITGLKVGVAFDYVFVSGQRLTADESAYADAYGLYASYQLTEKLSLHARGEYASTDTSGVLTPASADANGAKVVEFTGTLQYDLWKNVLSRLEFRWDHAADGSSPFGGASTFDNTVAGSGGNRQNAFLVAANLIYKF